MHHRQLSGNRNRLGIDILNKFNITYSEDLERLFLTQSDRQ
jgi:hypothetical protein